MRKPYCFHKPSQEGLTKMAVLRKAFADLDDLIRATTPVSREQACAITNLEQSCMWAIKSVGVNDLQSVVDAI